jgi:hypothetical protein
VTDEAVNRTLSETALSFVEYHIPASAPPAAVSTKLKIIIDASNLFIFHLPV